MHIPEAGSVPRGASRATEDGAPREDGAPPGTVGEAGSLSEKQPVVLVVDTDVVMRRLARETLEAAGMAVHEATDGVEGLPLVERLKPSLVLLDVTMPGTDGFAVCAAMRTIAGCEDIPVLVMTGLDDVGSITRAFDAGATDFVTRSVDYHVLPHRVRYVLRAHRAVVALRRSERMLKATQRIAGLGSWEWDARTNVFKLSDEMMDVLGVSRASRMTEADDVTRWVHPEDRERVAATLREARELGQPVSFEHRLRLEDGTERVILQEAMPADEGDASAQWFGTAQDITERKAAEQRILELAYYDTVTDLPNRVMLYKKLGAALEHRPADSAVAVLALDLDLFKRVNDALGHGAGDLLLRGVAERLTAAMPDGASLTGTYNGLQRLAPRDGRCDGCLVTRVGGDEFVVLLPAVPDVGYAQALAATLIEAVSEPFDLAGTRVVIGASIGIATYPTDGEDTETLLRHADAALYHAKANGRGRVEVFTAAITARTRSRLALEDDLRQALGRGEFELYYQPKVTAAGEELVGAEALLRWKHPQRGPVSPVEFIPVAEDTGLIGPLGEWVLRTALAQSAAWARGGVGAIGMAVNVSARQFRDRTLARVVQEIVAETGADPGRLEVELTEGALMDDSAACVEVLHQLRAMGIRVALDDFGTGYSSLSFLKRFPIDMLKIDRSFVCDVPTSRDSVGIASAIIAMGQSLSLTVVAEGVETREQGDFLRARRCDELQGYLYSPPLPAAAFEQWVVRRRESAAAVRMIRRSWAARPVTSMVPAGM